MLSAPVHIPAITVSSFGAGFAEPAKPVLLGPVGGRGDVALGQLQSRPLCRYGIDQATHGRAGRDPLGLADCLQRAGRITGGLPNPRQSGQAGGQRRGVAGRPETRNALGDLPQGNV